MEQCCKGLNLGCRACGSCDWQNKRDRPFPLLLCMGGFVSVIPLIPMALYAGVSWSNSCDVNWAIFLLVYCFIFIVNALFAWYLQARFLLKEKSDKYSGSCDRATHLICHDPGTLVFVVWAGVILIFNLVMAVIWGQDSSCTGDDAGMYETFRIAWIMLIVFFSVVLVFGSITVCACGNSSTHQEEEGKSRAGTGKKDEDDDLFTRSNATAVRAKVEDDDVTNPFDSHPKHRDPDQPPARPPKRTHRAEVGEDNPFEGKSDSDSDDFMKALDNQN